MKKSIYILGIESSCDDTSASVSCDAKIISNITANQIIHSKYGGVIPELASRAHQINIIPVVEEATSQANINKKDIDAVAVTQGPGLIGSLLVGTSFAKSLSIGLNVPFIYVNHLQAHILAHFIEDENSKTPSFPFLCLTVSGGHTQIVKVSNYFEMEILGQTLDDAAGETFDKAAKILGLSYPGGPIIDKLARHGNPMAFSFTKPKVNALDFSFSGLKTGILYFIQKQLKNEPNFVRNNLQDLCSSIQYTIIEILMDKLKAAVKLTGIKQVAIAGGVSANYEFRKKLNLSEENHGWTTYVPKLEYTTDNAAMIAITGYLKYKIKDYSNFSSTAKARLKLNK